MTSMELEAFHRVVAEAKAEHGAGPLARLDEALRWAEAGVPPPGTDPLQHSCSLYIAGLRTQPWWDPAAVPEVAPLEKAWQSVRTELDQLLRQQKGFQIFDEGPGGFRPEDTNFGWTTFFFRWACQDVPSNQALCPESSRVLRGLPNLAQQTYFSALKPGTHLEAHCGPYNFVLTLHLGLIIPPRCEMRVGRETRTWQEGKCLVFDDSLEHEVWHRGDRTRFILLLDVWHPDLTPLERDCLRRGVVGCEDANTRSGIPRVVDSYRGTLDGTKWWA